MAVIGLTQENLDRLLEDRPIRQLWPEQAQGVAMPRLLLVVAAGRTLAEVAGKIAAAPIAQYLADHAPAPGETVVVDVASALPGWGEAGPVTAVQLPDGVSLEQADAAIALCRQLGLRVTAAPA